MHKYYCSAVATITVSVAVFNVNLSSPISLSVLLTSSTCAGKELFGG